MRIPIYVTRKTADGRTAEFVVEPWLFSLVMWCVLVNVLLWSVVGVVVAVRVLS